MTGFMAIFRRSGHHGNSEKQLQFSMAFPRAGIHVCGMRFNDLES